MVTDLKNDGTLDYPNPMRDAVSTLPYHVGGVLTLTAGQVADLVKVGDLRRLENAERVAEAVHSGSAGASEFSATSADLLAWGVAVGDEAVNSTQDTSGSITAVSATTLVATGVTWNVNDVCRVNKKGAYEGARASLIRRFSINTDLPILVRVDGVPSADHCDIELDADESYFEANVRVASRIAVVGKVDTDTPRVRYAVWGI